jgi:hypothetical protein
MPAEVCWNCKKLKTGVTLCGDDRLCRECDCKNEHELRATRSTTGREKTVSSKSAATTAAIAESDSDPLNMELPDKTKQTKQPKKSEGKKVKSANTTVVNVDNERSVSESEQDDGSSCPQCLLPVTGNRTLKCDVCRLSHHSLCAAISDTVYDRLGKLLRDVGWVCVDCKTLARSLSVRIQSSVASLEVELATLRTQVSDLSDRVNVTCSHRCRQNNATETTTEEAQTTQQNNVRLQVNQNSDGGEIQTVVYRAFKDIARRKQNVIVHGLPESNIVTDCDAFLQLCESQLTSKPHVGVSDCVRIGKAEPDKPRRLLVRLRSEAMATQLLRSAPQLRQTDRSAGQQIYINPDLSPQEAKLAYEERKLRRERKSRRQTTNPVHVHVNTANTDLTKDLSDVCQPPTVSMAADAASVLGANVNTSASNGSSVTFRY